MNKISLLLLKKYLQANREEYGEIGIGLDLPEWSTQTAYGFFKEKIIITDSNSIYILNCKSKIREIILFFLAKNSTKIGNAEVWYQDILKTIFNRKLISLNNSSCETLSEEQLLFYKNFLRKNINEFYNLHENILIAKSKDAEAYVYTKKSPKK